MDGSLLMTSEHSLTQRVDGRWKGKGIPRTGRNPMGRARGGWGQVDRVSDREDEVLRVEAEAGVGLGAEGCWTKA